jgi:hypothetical protein
VIVAHNTISMATPTPPCPFATHDDPVHRLSCTECATIFVGTLKAIALDLLEGASYLRPLHMSAATTTHCDAKETTHECGCVVLRDLQYTSQSKLCASHEAVRPDCVYRITVFGVRCP